MNRNSKVSLLLVTIVTSLVIEGSQPILQRTIQTLFEDRSYDMYPGDCKWLRPSLRQSKMCRREPRLVQVLETAKTQAIEACEDTFKFDRWNCSLIFNGKQKKTIFSKVYRETAFIYALVAASLAHAVAKGCASGNLMKCSCSFGKNVSRQWKTVGCGDDFRHGKRVTRNFLDLKHAGTDQIGEVLKQNVLVGIDSVGQQMREVCKCHGFSGSCTTKTCWRKLGPFNSAMGSLKKQYHHAVKKSLLNYTTKRAIAPKLRRRLNVNRKSLVYLQKSPNLCASTAGRVCKGGENCATLCCGRGFTSRQETVDTRCRCRMVNCCFVKCDTCEVQVDIFTCK